MDWIICDSDKQTSIDDQIENSTIDNGQSDKPTSIDGQSEKLTINDGKSEKPTNIDGNSDKPKDKGQMTNKRGLIDRKRKK